MAREFIALDVGRVRRDIGKVKLGVQAGADVAVESAKQSMTQYALFLLGKAQAKINNRSRKLSASATIADLVETEEEIIVPFGFNSPHGAQTDRGGEIRAKRAKNLAVPLPPIMTPSGIPRFSSPREEPNLSLIKGKTWLFLGIRPKGRKLVRSDLHWLLTPRVFTKGTLYFSSTIEENKDKTAELVGIDVKKGLEGS
jgi:hypothetical protein